MINRFSIIHQALVKNGFFFSSSMTTIRTRITYSPITIITLIDFPPRSIGSHVDFSDGHNGFIPYLPQWTCCIRSELEGGDKESRRCCSRVEG